MQEEKKNELCILENLIKQKILCYIICASGQSSNAIVKNLNYAKYYLIFKFKNSALNFACCVSKIHNKTTHTLIQLVYFG